ncbi:MAG: pyridoxal 5'-phosphate synthase glutaminase subunit PdxT [Candidatus Micrarchaeia archaeon]
MGEQNTNSAPVVGVLAVQGAVSEHIASLENAFFNLKIKGSARAIKFPEELAACDALVIPGGESTTISRMLLGNNLFAPIKARAEKGMPVMGTCAGMVLLAKKGGAQVKKTKQRLLGLMDFAVERNAFGRQNESFESNVELSFSKKRFNGVFIRAPAPTKLFGAAKPIAKLGEKVVGVRQGGLVAFSFHPELTGDLLVHEWFLKKTVV